MNDDKIHPRISAKDFPLLSRAMGYAAGLADCHDCFADRAIIVLYREILRLRRELNQKG
jgi:hypothetical protein